MDFLEGVILGEAAGYHNIVTAVNTAVFHVTAAAYTRIIQGPYRTELQSGESTLKVKLDQKKTSAARFAVCRSVCHEGTSVTVTRSCCESISECVCVCLCGVCS